MVVVDLHLVLVFGIIYSDSITQHSSTEVCTQLSYYSQPMNQDFIPQESYMCSNASSLEMGMFILATLVLLAAPKLSQSETISRNLSMDLYNWTHNVCSSLSTLFAEYIRVYTLLLLCTMIVKLISNMLLLPQL